VDATGSGTEIGRIGKALATIETSKTALEAEVSRVVRVLAVLGMTACAIVGVAYGLSRGRWLDGVLAGLTLAISMIPEEFPVILTIFLALGAWRISQSRVLTRRFPAIETLGSATVLCADKSGTLTMNRMAVEAVSADDGSCTAVDNTSVAALSPLCISTVEWAALSCRLNPFDPMERAILELADRLGVAEARHDWALIHEYPLSDDLMAVCSVWQRSAPLPLIVAAKGAPEAILDLCRIAPSARSCGRSTRWARMVFASSRSRAASTARPTFRRPLLGSRSSGSGSSAWPIPSGRRFPPRSRSAERQAFA
jgi:Ca2+-transporting ATPase